MDGEQISKKNTHSDKIADTKRKALIIAISNYRDPKLYQLPFCENDGEEVATFLADNGYEIAGKLMGNVEPGKMREAIITFFEDRSIKADDMLVFYFSGHGIPDGHGDIFLSSSTINLKQPLPLHGYSFDELTNNMHRSISRSIVTILDCCYSGAARLTKTNDDAVADEVTEAMLHTYETKAIQNEGKYLMASSLAYQESVIPTKLGHSLFSYYLLEGLKGGIENGVSKSVDEEGNVTPVSLGSYLYEKVTEQFGKFNQKPLLMKTENSKQVILKRYPQHARFSEIMHQGISHLEKKEYREAKECFRKAVSINPKNDFAHKNKGIASIRMASMGMNGVNEYDEAIISFKNCLDINSKDYEAWFYCGLAYSRLGNHKYAVSCLNESITTNTGSKELALDALRERGTSLNTLEDYSLVTKWGSQGLGNGQFNTPYGIATDRHENVYVADTGNNRIQKFDNQGNFITKWGSQGSGNGQFNVPYGIAVDNYCNVFVADVENHRIQKFSNY